MEFVKNNHLYNNASINKGPWGNLFHVSLSAKEVVGEFYIKGTIVVSFILLQHFWEAPYKPERLRGGGGLVIL